MSKIFRANGKLLLTGEYFILDGAEGLALPTKFGQTLSVEPSEEKGISWKSLDHENNLWFEATFNQELEIISASDKGVAATLRTILTHCHLTTHDLHLTTTLDFPNNWGLGSSSTLISLIAQWTGADPYDLLANTFGGSGYDIACATATKAITYQRMTNNTRQVKEFDFQPPFSGQLYFLHLNQKQNSREGIQHYRQLTIDKAPFIEQISELTHKVINAIDLDECCYYLEVHEQIVAQVLQLPKVKTSLFPDFPGTIKSLGAWGGDFVLVASAADPTELSEYFEAKGYLQLIPYADMILT